MSNNFKKLSFFVLNIFIFGARIHLICILNFIFQNIHSLAFRQFFQNKNKNLKGADFIADLLNPKNDYVFKRIFGYIGNEDITKSLLNSILNIQIKNLSLDCNPILEKDLFDDKIGILDIKAKLDDDTLCDIEMQIIDRKNIEKRILFYWSKLYSQELKLGNDYDNLKKTIIVLFADYELENLKEVPKSITKWQIREEDYPKFVLTNMLEIYILELPKFEKYRDKNKNNGLNLWIDFIRSPGVIDMENTNNEEIKKAKEVLEEISQNERERYLAELRQKYILAQKAIEDAGFDKGSKQNSIKIARKMLADNVNIQTIIKYTELTEEEIKNLI